MYIFLTRISGHLRNEYHGRIRDGDHVTSVVMATTVVVVDIETLIHDIPQFILFSNIPINSDSCRKMFLLTYLITTLLYGHNLFGTLNRKQNVDNLFVLYMHSLNISCIK